MQKLWGAGGLTALSLFMLMGFLNRDIPFGPPGLTAFGLMVVLPAAGAALLVRSHLQGRRVGAGQRDAIRLQTIRSEVLRLAARKAGKLTVPEVMGELAIDKTTTETALEALHLEELVEIQVTDSGMIVYEFPDIRRLGEKDSARGVLDT
jgi:anti-sigma regulatory factor (Ser/Thr protein kinase)